jgi:hypothetical protein
MGRFLALANGIEQFRMLAAPVLAGVFHRNQALGPALKTSLV